MYSLSRRMGRPREKRNVQDVHTCRNPDNAPSEKSRSHPPTPAAISPHYDRAVSDTGEPELDTDTNPAQVADNWHIGPSDGHFEPSDPADNTQDLDTEPTINSLDYLQTFSPTDLNGSCHFSTLSCFLEDAMPSYNNQGTVSARSAGVFDSQEPLSTRLSSTVDETLPNLTVLHQSSLQERLDACSGKPAEVSSQTDPTSGTGNAASLNSISGFDLEFLNDISGTQTVPCGTARTPNQPSIDTSVEEGPCLNYGLFGISERKRPDRCSCISSLLQSIWSLKELQKDSKSVSIDRALIMETESKDYLSQFLGCQSCCRDASNHLLGLMCIRIVLDILNRTVREEFVPRSKDRISMSSSRAVFVNKPRSNLDHTSSSSRSQASDAGIEGCDLYIGSFKVTPRVRSRFLHKALQARFHKLLVMMSNWEKLVNGSSSSNTTSYNSFRRAASLLLEDVERDLKIIAGWVELKNVRDI